VALIVSYGYFRLKGYGDFEEYVYPPSLNDLPSMIPEMRTKVEITPFSERIDPTTGLVEIGWNLFVLGTNRMFLGYSYHDSAQDLQRSFDITANSLPHESKRKAADIVDFIIETLAKNKDGLIDPNVVGRAPNIMKNVDGYQNSMLQQGLPSGTSFGYEKTRPVN